MRTLLAFAFAVSFATVASATEPAAITPVSLPTIGMNGQNNGTWNMAQQKNSVFVFEAFANFCSYCNKNAPLVDQMATKWKSEPRVQVLDLGVDKNPREYAQWMQRHKPNHVVLNDGGKILFGQLAKENSIPQTWVVDCQGMVHEHTIGGWDTSMITQLNAAIKEALEVTCQ